jgi:P pilus assembly chaperone PapD
MKNFLSKTLVALLLLTGLSSNLQAAGNLMVTPTRIVFEQRDRSAQITLINQSDKTSSYRISFVRQYMTEDGQFLPVEEGEPGLFSDPMIRFSPRQVSLPPGQSQVIRLALRRPADMADGEYRSHMLFQALPEPSSTNVEALTQQKPEGISIELVPIVGISIPVIVRHGDLHSAVTLSNARIVSGSESGSVAKVSVDINRDGNSSAYGDLRVTFTPEGAAPIVIAQVNGVAVYADMPSRRLQMRLNLPTDLKLENGEVDFVFLESGADEKSGLLARTLIILN